MKTILIADDHAHLRLLVTTTLDGPLIEEAVGMFEHTSAEHTCALALAGGELPVCVDADRVRQT